MKIKFRNWLWSKNDPTHQISTPYVSLYWDTSTPVTGCFSIGILIGEIQFWFGKLDDLV